MKYIAFIFSVVALVFSYQAYERTKRLDELRPLAQVVSEAQAKKAALKEKTATAREKVARVLEDLAEEIRK